MGWKRPSKLNPLNRGAERDLQITQEFVTYRLRSCSSPPERLAAERSEAPLLSNQITKRNVAGSWQRPGSSV